MIKTTVAVVITTYNRPKALAWVLAGLARQTQPPDVVAIADDGSGPETTKLISSMKVFWEKNLPSNELIHVWQKDDGFQAARIRNKAVAACLSREGALPDQIVFLDGDSIPLPHFIAAHQTLLGPKEDRLVVAGGRVLLNATFTRLLEESPPGPESLVPSPSLLSWPSLLKWRLKGGLNRISTLVRLPDSNWRLKHPKKWESLRTCNVAMWSEDLIKVNGLNENFTGWGFEDSDLAIRLIRSGVRIKNGRFATNVLHMWHPEADRSALEANKRLLEHSWDDPIFTKKGVIQHLQGAT